jgi:hypothetical protein
MVVKTRKRPRLFAAGSHVTEWFNPVKPSTAIRCRSAFRKDLGLRGQRQLAPFRFYFYTITVTSPALIILALRALIIR